MKSYEQWKLIKESIGPAITLGVQSPNVIGTVGTSFGFSEIDAILDEAKKKCANKKCSKKMDGELDAGDDVEPEPEVEKKPVEAPEDEPEVDDDAEGDEGEGDEGDEEEGEPEAEEKPTLFQKKKMKKKMKKEDYDFWQSLQTQLGGALPGTKYNDGISEYKAGEVGFAPQGKIGNVGFPKEKVEIEATAETIAEILNGIINDPRVPEEVKAQYVNLEDKGEDTTDENTKRAGISNNYPAAYAGKGYAYPDIYFTPISANAPGKLAGKMGS